MVNTCSETRASESPVIWITFPLLGVACMVSGMFALMYDKYVRKAKNYELSRSLSPIRLAFFNMGILILLGISVISTIALELGGATCSSSRYPLWISQLVSCIIAIASLYAICVIEMRLKLVSEEGDIARKSTRARKEDFELAQKCDRISGNLRQYSSIMETVAYGSLIACIVMIFISSSWPFGVAFLVFSLYVSYFRKYFVALVSKVSILAPVKLSIHVREPKKKVKPMRQSLSKAEGVITRDLNIINSWARQDPSSRSAEPIRRRKLSVDGTRMDASSRSAEPIRRRIGRAPSVDSGRLGKPLPPIGTSGVVPIPYGTDRQRRASHGVIRPRRSSRASGGFKVPISRSCSTRRSSASSVDVKE